MYSGVAGIDEKALNLFVSEFYGCARDHIFHKVISVAEQDLEPLTSLEYDVSSAPRIGFVPTSEPPADGSSLASFELWVDHFTLTLHYSGATAPTSLAGTVHATADLVADVAGGVLVPRLTGTTLHIEDEQKLSEIFNKIISPHLDEFLQEKLLDPIRVPALRAGDLTLNGPSVATNEDRLLITAAVVPATPAPAPLVGGWPDGVVFVAADFKLVNDLAEQLLPKIGTKSGEWKKTIKFVVGQSTIKASYSATVTKLTLAPVPDQPTMIEGTATISGTMTAKAKNLFNVSGPGEAKATVTAEAVVNDANGLGVRLTGLKPFSIRFTTSGPASGFAKYAEAMSNAASVVLHDAITAALKEQPPLEVGTLPKFEVPVEDHVYVLEIKNPAIQAIQADGRALLAATAVPDVHVRPGAS